MSLADIQVLEREIGVSIPDISRWVRSLYDWPYDIVGYALVNKKIYGILLPNLGLEQLPDLSHFTDVRRLYLQGNQLSELPWNHLPLEIEFLEISNNNLSELIPTKHFDKLDILHAEGNVIATVRNLDMFPVLGVLDLTQNQLLEVPPVAGLSRLRGLFLDYNMITSLEPLRDLPGILTLSLKQNKIRDLTPVARLPTLEELDLWANPVSDPRGLGGLSKLYTLNLLDTPFLRAAQEGNREDVKSGYAKAVVRFAGDLERGEAALDEFGRPT